MVLKMNNLREVSGNTFGNHATIIQGNVNPTHPLGSFFDEISETDPALEKERIMTLKGPFYDEAFSWILNQDTFQRWYNAHTGIFWIKGDPGKGKTMLLCGIIEKLEPRSTVNTALSYFFCQATDYRSNTEVAVLKGLIFSFIKKQPVLLHDLRKKYQIVPKYRSDGPTLWYLLKDMLTFILQHPTIIHPICIVDALDECDEHCRLLLEFIKETNHYTKWLISSRNVKRIEQELQSAPQELQSAPQELQSAPQELQSVPQMFSLELKENAEHISYAVNSYIDYCLQSIQALKNDEQLRQRTLVVLKEKARGTFLWVALTMEQLRKADHFEVEDILDEIPESLENLYTLIIRRSQKGLRPKSQEACKAVFAVVATAERPLHIKELMTFIQGQWKYSQGKLCHADMYDVVKNCGSLLTIQDDTVYFIHQSAKDYIQESTVMPIFPHGISHQHAYMFETSLNEMERVLQYNIYQVKIPGASINNISAPDPDPLAPIAYCCIFWTEHLIQLLKTQKRKEYLDNNGRVHLFLKNCFLKWLEALLLLRSFIPHAIKAAGNLKNIHTPGDGAELQDFIKKVYRFTLHSKDSVVSWPLQLYYSAFAFEEPDSVIHKNFNRDICSLFMASPRVISMQKGKCSLLHTIKCSPPPSESDKLLFSPNSELISLPLCEPNTTIVWRADTGDIQRIFPIGKECQISFSPGSDHLISASKDGGLKTWRINDGLCVAERHLHLDISPHPDSSQHFPKFAEQLTVLSPAGDLVTSLHRKPQGATTVKVWQTATGNCIGEIFQSDIPVLPFGAFSAESKLLALTYSTAIEIFCSRTYQSVQRYDWPWGVEEYDSGHNRPHVMFSQDSKLLAALAWTGRLRLWNNQTGQILHQLDEILGERWVLSFAISPDAKILAMGYGDATHLWNIHTAEYLDKVTGDSATISFSPNWETSKIMAGSYYGPIELIRADINQISPEAQNHEYDYKSVLISPNSTIIAASHDNHGDIGIWSGITGECLYVLEGNPRDYENFELRPILLTFSTDSLLLAVVEGLQNADVHIWRVDVGKSLCVLRGRDEQIVSAAFSPDSKYLALGYEGAHMAIWCMKSKACICRIDLDTHTFDPEGQRRPPAEKQGAVTAVAFSPDSKYIALGLYENITQIRHFRSNEIPVAFQVEHTNVFTGGVRKLSFSHDSTILMSADMSNRVQLWSVTNGALLLGAHESLLGHLLMFDSINDQILTERMAMRKITSWKDYRIMPRPGWSLVRGWKLSLYDDPDDDPHAEPEAELDAELDAEPDAEPDYDPYIYDPQAEPEAELDAEPHYDLYMYDPHVEPEAELNAELDYNLYNHYMEPEAKLDAEPDYNLYDPCTELEAELNAELDYNLYNHYMEPEAKLDAEPDYNLYDPYAELEAELDSEPDAEPDYDLYDSHGYWIYFNGEPYARIDSDLKPALQLTSTQFLDMSDCLLAFITRLQKIVIIRLPNLQQLNEATCQSRGYEPVCIMQSMEATGAEFNEEWQEEQNDESMEAIGAEFDEEWQEEQSDKSMD